MANDPILEALDGYGSDAVMLPGGLEVRIELPLVVEMLRSGALPATLRSLALSFASPDGLDTDALEGDERSRWTELVDLLACRSVKAVRPVARGGEGAPCQCGGWHTEAPFTPYTFTPETLNQVLPRVDRIALHDMVLRLRTPKQVDALSRVAHERMDPDVAAEIVRSERGATLDGWTSFRRFGGGAVPVPDSDDLGESAVGAGRGNRSTRRAAARRRAGPAAGTAPKGRRAVRKD